VRDGEKGTTRVEEKQMRRNHRALTLVAAAASTLIAIPTTSQAELSPPRSATISGWIILGGGPPTPTSSKRVAGAVSLRTVGGKLLYRVHATREHGFRIRLKPGRYEIGAVEEIATPTGVQKIAGCPASKRIIAKPQTVAHVTLYGGLRNPVTQILLGDKEA
jgi:hypothetical protein